VEKDKFADKLDAGFITLRLRDETGRYFRMIRSSMRMGMNQPPYGIPL